MIFNQIQGGRWDTFLRRLLPIKDRSIAPILASELVGQVVVQEWEPEFFKLRDEALGIAVANQVAVAAEFSHNKIRNPIDSGSLVVLEKIIIRPGAAALLEIVTSASLAAGFTDRPTGFRDLRSGALTAAGVTVAQVSSDSNVAQLGGLASALFDVASGVINELELTFILPPGTELLVRVLTVNVGLATTFFWRERPAERSELDI